MNIVLIKTVTDSAAATVNSIMEIAEAVMKFISN